MSYTAAKTQIHLQVDSKFIYFRIMKTTIDIPDNELSAAMHFTGAKTKRAAVVAALVDFNRRHRMAELIKYSGSFKGMLSNEEIEDMDLSRMKSAYGADFKYSDAPEPTGQVAEDAP